MKKKSEFCHVGPERNFNQFCLSGLSIPGARSTPGGRICLVAATDQPTLEVLSTEIQIVDDLGIEITLAAPAQKIISISPSLTEILFSIGAGDRLIGRDSNSNYPAEALEAIDLGGMWEGIPIEDLLSFAA